MIEEWQSASLQSKYVKVEKLGGPGDKGRDVICTDNNNDSFVYQCKHYDRKLSKHDVLLEIGKCCYHCSKGDYPTPKKYYFVSPQGVSPQARDLLAGSKGLREELKANWEKICQFKISSSGVELKGNLLAFIDQLDFSVFSYISPLEFLEDFKKTAYYTKWFGKLFRPRKLITAAPDEIQENEMTYIGKILEAYGEFLGRNIEDAKNLKATDPKLWLDFNRQRLYFYSAEYLAAFSRETYAPELQCFEQLKDEFYYGIIDEIQEDAKNGFERLKKVLKRAESLITSPNNPLSSEVNIKDRKGICHHLANEREDIRWKK
ncbi:MAG: ABC-three component system protein [Candidatus Bathyarchaeia archaeon]